MQTKIIEKLCKGDKEAYNTLCLLCQSLAIPIVKAFLRRWPTYAYLEDDLLSNGTLVGVETVAKIRDNRVDVDNVDAYLSRAIRRSLLDLIVCERSIKTPLTSTLIFHQQYVCFDSMESNNRPRPEARIEAEDEIFHRCRTPEEYKVMSMKIRGYSDREIGETLGLKRSTVQYIREKIGERINGSE